ncbi:hypothetical protein TNIN_393691 [Trichonephila inaurata madagascariensis]|uniref:Uncharacterized protein n=1 Tax=Trichonephila inaurata madagascariensis TaxID=2747483 RepID=A0A8X7CIL0_9ARAC|nr:hypothetical protein TNIN_393691 [Trichonephila inaurata madagascariensis]
MTLEYALHYFNLKIAPHEVFEAHSNLMRSKGKVAKKTPGLVPPSTNFRITSHQIFEGQFNLLCSNTIHGIVFEEDDDDFSLLSSTQFPQTDSMRKSVKSSESAHQIVERST